MKFLNNLKKYWYLYTIIIAIIGGISWIFSQGEISNEKENRLFTTPQIRMKTESYIEQRPSAAQEMRAYILDSVEKNHRMKSRDKSDAIFLEEVKLRKEEAAARKITDSFIKLNADQMYQIKEILRKKGDSI